MTAIYKVKFTRNSNSDAWPIEHFASGLAAEVQTIAEGTLYQPAGGIQNFYVDNLSPAAGFVSYSYEEYDPSLNIDEQDVWDLNSSENDKEIAIKTFYLDGSEFRRVFTPSALTHTMLITFDTWENLQSFLTNCSWTQGPTKAEFTTYLTSVGQTVEETFVNNGTTTTSPINLFS